MIRLASNAHSRVDAMDFGLLYELGVPRPWTPTSEYDVYWKSLEQVRTAEASGFTHVWAVEHHFLEEFSHSGAPEVWLTAVAQHTKTIRIGHGVVLAPPPFNHPVRTAERVAALDIMSNGRVEFGTGRSITSEELGGFGIDPADTRAMWRESLELITKIWKNEGAVEFDGKYVKLPLRRVQPRPIQTPHPPLWAACTSPDSYTQAGNMGLGILAFGMAIDANAMGRRIAEYKAKLKTSTPIGAKNNEQVAVFMMAFCAPTDREARAVAEKAFSQYMDRSMEYFLHWGRGGALPAGYEWYAAASQSAGAADRVKFDYLFENGMILCGSPDTICGHIAKYQSIGATQMIMGTQIGGIPHDEAMKSIKLTGEAVIPQFRNKVLAKAAS
jgi:alkanesulfonate monooxygenase SsuD/methylene tetrahydromethanopterin reductase-like flavin-dependent oxidoreductase (luciferase family)